MVSFTTLFTAGLMASSALAMPRRIPEVYPIVQRSAVSNSTSKRGVAYNDINAVAPLTNSGKMSWAYNWAATEVSLPSDVEFVPMLWGLKTLGGWIGAVESFLSSATGAKYIMGFNEPDNVAQAYMSPQDAASNYLQYITNFSGRSKLVSPAVTSSTNQGQGLSWFQEFMGHCASCDISVLAVHWYGDSVEDLKSFIQRAVKTAADYNLSEVWLTEFARNADINGITPQTEGAAAAFVHQATTYLDSQANLTRYSYFKAAPGYTLFDSTLNSVGSAYIS